MTNLFENLDMQNPVVEGVQGEYFEFASYRFVKKINFTLKSGAVLEVPEIQINGASWTRNGMEEGGNNTAYLLESVGVKKDETPFTFVHILYDNCLHVKLTDDEVKSMPEFFINAQQQKALDEKKEAYFSVWANFYQTSIGKLPPDKIAQIGGGMQFHAKAKLVEYEKRPQLDDDKEPVKDDNGKPLFWRSKYHTDWGLFDTVEALNTAKAEYWANGESSSSDDGLVYPTVWEGEKWKPTMVKMLTDSLNEDGKLKESVDLVTLATSVSLKEEFTPDYRKILTKHLGIPDPILGELPELKA